MIGENREKKESNEERASGSAAKEYLELSATLQKLAEGLTQINNKFTLMMLLQLCRDREAHTEMAQQLGKAVARYIESSIESLEKRLLTHIELMKKADNELNDALTNILAPMNSLTSELKNIIGAEEASRDKGMGIQGLFLLNEEARRDVLKLVEDKKAAFTKIHENFEMKYEEIASYIRRLQETLTRYSIESEIPSPFLIGIPIVVVRVGSAMKIAVLSKGLNKYNEKIASYVLSSPRLGVDVELYNKALDTIKKRRGFLYRLFLKSITR